MTKDIVFIDLESTGLICSLGAVLSMQPHTTEVCIIRMDSKAEKIIDELTALVKPPIEIPGFITKITGIDDETVKSSPPMNKVLPKIKKIMSGAGTMVAQNLRFDKDLLAIEAERADFKLKFPKKLFCTVEQSMHIKGIRMTSKELIELCGGVIPENLHRAKADVLQMINYYRYIVKGGEMNDHILYKTGDKNAPDSIKDNNGEVCLDLCKFCGGVECQLATNCPGRKITEKEGDLICSGELDFHIKSGWATCG